MTTDALATLTTAETDRLSRLEGVIATGQQTFIEVGLALATIRDARLYRADHPTFEAYLTDRWPEIGRRRAYQLMDAAEVAEHVNHGSQPAITNERQARALSGLTPAQQREVVSEAGANGTLTAAAIERAAAKHKAPPDLESVRTRVRVLGGSLSVSDGEYHLTLSSETRHSAQWSLIKEAVAKAEAMPVRRRADGQYEAVLPNGQPAAPRRTVDDARAVGEHWATVATHNAEAAQDAPSPPTHPETPDRPVAAHAAPLVQPAATLTRAPDWRTVADRAIRHLNWPPPRLDDPSERRRVYKEALDLLAAMTSGLGYAPETVTTELAVQIGIYVAPPAATPAALPIPAPDDIAARAAALGLTLTDAGGGCLIPHWPDERPGEMTGMDAFEARGWLMRTAPPLAGDRLADGRLTLPGVGWDTDTLATAEDYADVCAFLSDLAAAEAGGLDTHTIRDLGDVLEGLVAVFDDDTYTALAERVTAVQGGA